MMRSVWVAGLALSASTYGATAAAAAVNVARATDIPACSRHVDAAAKRGGEGTATEPHKTIAAAVSAAKPGDVICVAEGLYAEQLTPGEKYFTLAGGFQSGQGFQVRDSAKYVTKAKGAGASFLRIADPGPKGDQLTAIDGFEITGYSQAIIRDYYESQRFDLTNNFIHDNLCKDDKLAGAGFALNNVSGTIRGNVIKNNKCGRGGAGFLNDTTNQNSVVIENNLVDGNAGTEADSSHGGALYFFGNTLRVTDNLITNNSVTNWGGGLYIGAYRPGNQPSTATMSGNVYRGNKAGDSGGGFFCDDGATCVSSNEIYDSNCGGNILVDGGAEGAGPTSATFDHITSVGALAPDCGSPGDGMFIDTYDALAPDTYRVTNAIFWGNADGKDFAVSCGSKCAQLKVAVDNTMAQTKYVDGSIKITFGAGMAAPADPMFVDAKAGDFNLQDASPARGKASDGGDLGARSGEAQAAAAESKKPVAKGPEPKAKAAAPPPVAEPAPKAEEPDEAEAGSTESAAASADSVSAKQAFDDAKDLGTVEAWNAFLESYPAGFHANLARAYLKKLGAGESGPAAPKAAAASKPAEPAPPAPKTAPAPEANVTPSPEKAKAEAGPAANVARKPAIARGEKYMGFDEKFNRRYTDPGWTPAATVFVSPDGGGDGASPETPMAAQEAVAAAKPGTLIYFTRGAYQGGFEFTKDNSGTYEDPIILAAEPKQDGTIGVSMGCGYGSRKVCINLEGADYIAIEGFEFIGGTYGVRVVGGGFPASEHSRGIAVLNSKGHDQEKDPFFSAQSDWNVWEGNVAFGAKKGDGHGFYITNGGDWHIARYNETFGNESSDFQINADPASTCKEVGVPFDDPRCDAYAGEGEGGQGACDYMLVENNYFHHGNFNGANFTSVRRSVVRNNIFGFYPTKHGVSFWQETDNPKLGSSDNKILHNLFVTTGRHGVKFEANSTRNDFANNVILGVKIEGGAVTANPAALLMEVDETVGENIYRGNLYVSGKFEGREPGKDETRLDEFQPAWFAKFPATLNHDPNDFAPMPASPLLGAGALSKDAAVDRNGAGRAGKVDLGPIEVK